MGKWPEKRGGKRSQAAEMVDVEDKKKKASV
jgi:hypothetical protein